MNLEVIQGTPLHERYLKAFTNIYLSDPHIVEHKKIGAIIKAIYYGTKYIINHKYTDGKAISKEEIESKFQCITIVEQLMALLTPTQFENLFPIEKTYDGEKNGWKDYFFVKEKLSHYPDKPIGNKIEDLLWDYQNDNIELFMVTMLSTASKLRQCQGGQGIMEEWAEENGIKTLTVNEQDGYIMDNETHRTMPYHKPVPDYIHVVR